LSVEETAQHRLGVIVGQELPAQPDFPGAIPLRLAAIAVDRAMQRPARWWLGRPCVPAEGPRERQKNARMGRPLPPPPDVPRARHRLDSRYTVSGTTNGARYRRLSRRFASSEPSPTNRSFAGSTDSVRPS